MIDPSGSRTLLQVPAQRAELLARPRRHHFNITVLAVAHPAGDTQLRRFALYKPAEADALHASGNKVAPSFEIVRHEDQQLAAGN